MNFYKTDEPWAVVDRDGVVTTLDFNGARYAFNNSDGQGRAIAALVLEAFQRGVALHSEVDEPVSAVVMNRLVGWSIGLLGIGPEATPRWRASMELQIQRMLKP